MNGVCRIIGILLCLALIQPCLFAQKKSKRDTEQPAVQADTTKKEKEKEKKSKIKKYDEIVTEDAISDEGLFNVHKVDGKYYFEIPASMLDREVLLVSRISGFVKGLNFGGAGMKSRPQQVIRWQKHDDQILMRSVSYHSVATETDPVYRSVRNNNFEPVVSAFAIEAYNRDTTGYLVDMTKFFTTDVEMIGALSQGQRKQFEISGFAGDQSLIAWMKSFPQNIEVRHILTYRGKKLPDNQVTGTISIEMNQSFILLPEDVWSPRKYDDRVGYFSIAQTNYSSDLHKADSRSYITRWRLEPKDPVAYARGELVEPVKPIVYYIDPATPLKWRTALKQGIEDWQVAFEAAGFKNAILAKDPPSPEEDPDWSPEDVRYSVIRYITTEIQNAQGPHVHDPRSGEILESDILWYHNVMNLLRNWFVSQTGGSNPTAQTSRVPDAVMSDLIRFVAAHEVGHTLGLPHNMGSSPAYSVDSLRSPSFTTVHGTAPSIMDYARFNYVAQPGDGVTNYYPRIGDYDKWSISYGYKYLPGDLDPESEARLLNQWVLQHAGNPVYRYGRQRGNPFDPSAQTEDLGDDAVKASLLGIANLKRVVPNLITWTTFEGEAYDELEDLYASVVAQFGRFVRHVTCNIGGVYEEVKTTDQDGVIFTRVPAEKQRSAMEFLQQQVFQTPSWLLDEEILGRLEEAGRMEHIRRIQSSALNQLFDADRLYRLTEAELEDGAQYGITEMFKAAQKGIWSELDGGGAIDGYRRNLQRAYVTKMDELLHLEDARYDQSDIKAQVRYSLKQLADKTEKVTGTTSRSMHLADIHDRIEAILDHD